MLTDLPVGERVEVEAGLAAALVHDDVVLFATTDGNLRERDVRYL